MKKFRIVELDSKILKYRVDQRHWILGIIPYWDNGARDLCPKYLFETKEEALDAIINAVTVKSLICVFKDEEFLLMKLN